MTDRKIAVRFARAERGKLVKRRQNSFVRSSMAAKSKAASLVRQRNGMPKSTNRKSASRISWLDVGRKSRDYNFHEYMQIVAHARYVFRTVQRLIDNCARNHGVEPLEHQAMIQIYGASEQRLPIGRLAERLDIDSALASRLVQQLESRLLVRRTRSEEDKRAIYVSLTSKGERQIRSVVEDVHTEVEFFRLVSDESQRRATHEIAAFYVGSLGAEDIVSSRRKPAGRLPTISVERSKARKAGTSRSMV